MIRNIIFDWSGTLVDDLPAVLAATNFVLAQCGAEAMSLEKFRAEFCLPFKSFYERFTPGVPLADLERSFHSHFRHAQEEVRALPHALEFLVFCRKHAVRTFVLSTVHPDYFEAQAAGTGFGQYIERPYLGIWDKRAKIVELLAENQLAASETLFIGDMQHDIETAKHGGVHSCAVLTGYNGLEQLRASEPDLIVEHLGELRDVLERAGFDLGGGRGGASGLHGGGADIRRRQPGADGADAEMVQSLGHTGRENQGRRAVGGGVAAGNSGGNRPGGRGNPVCHGAGLHQFQGILPAGAFCPAQLHLPGGGRRGG